MTVRSPGENQALLTLLFLATGSFLSVAGDFYGVYKTSRINKFKT